eukprot:IDg21561t1
MGLERGDRSTNEAGLLVTPIKIKVQDSVENDDDDDAVARLRRSVAMEESSQGSNKRSFEMSLKLTVGEYYEANKSTKSLRFPGVEYVFLPPNVTAAFQPLDMGVLIAVKTIARKE